LAWALIGFAIGVLLTAGGAWGLLRRHLRRVRVAERRARSAERLAELGATTSGLAHEIKNPLSTIGLNAQLLAEGIQDLDAAAEAKAPLIRRVGVLGREVERLRGILSDFLSYAGELRLSKEVVDVNAVVDELVDFFTPQAVKNGVQLRADLARGKLMACVDVAAIKQAVLNLMLNAVQAMAPRPRPGPAAAGGGAGAMHQTGNVSGAGGAPGGGSGAKELIIRTRGGATDVEGKAGDGQDAQRGSVLIEVIDTGPGIPPDALASIFKPYFTTKAGGTGLGLPTTRRIVEAHEGRVEVHSESGRGTSFRIVLPAETVGGV